LELLKEKAVELINRSKNESKFEDRLLTVQSTSQFSKR
jgi:hypothetical protein